MDYIMQFKNYKLLREKQFNMSDNGIMFIKGKNKVGKTSIKNSVLSALQVKEVSNDPITHGEQEGHRIIPIRHRNGRIYDIHTDFSGDKIKWYAIDDNGNKISKVTEIRDLLQYNAFTAEDFIKKSYSAKGRREQLEVLLKLLPEDKQNDYIYFEAKEKEAYDSRTEINKEIDKINAVCNSNIVSDDDRELYKNKDKYINGLSKLKKEKDELLSSNKRKELNDKLEQEKQNHKSRHDNFKATESNKLKNIEDINTEINRLMAKLETERDELEIIRQDYQEKEDASEKLMYALVEEIKNTPDNTEKLEKVTVRINDGEAYVSKINVLKEKIESFDENNKKLTYKTKELSDIEESLKNFRQSKKDLFKDSSLKDFNIEFKDDYLYIDGFMFDENSICTSDVYKLVARILIAINKNVPIIVMGNSSELDNDSLEEMYKLAVENDYLMIFDEVDRDDSELKVVCYENL